MLTKPAALPIFTTPAETNIDALGFDRNARAGLSPSSTTPSAGTTRIFYRITDERDCYATLTDSLEGGGHHNRWAVIATHRIESYWDYTFGNTCHYLIRISNPQ